MIIIKTVVITGSANGLGFEMAKVFKENNVNVVISDVNEFGLKNAKQLLNEIKTDAKVMSVVCDVTKTSDIENLIKEVKKEFRVIDIWINNAGVNQPEKTIWMLSEDEINTVLDVDLKGTIQCSRLIMREMVLQDFGAIYNVEGYGSNDAMMTGLSIYGTSKRAVTYFTQAMAKESESKNAKVIIGRLSPGIMITDFLVNALNGKEKIALSDKTKKIYNILGDKPDVVARFLVSKMLTNTKNNVKLEWLTKRKAAWRFMTSNFNKRDFFEE